MAVIKSVEIMSVAKIKALFGIVLGLFWGCLFALFGVSIGFEKSLPGVEIFSLSAIIIFPIILGILALITGAILALLYNAFASKIGGIEIELGNK
jgi:uncharacterized membrane protein (DUF485 family)